MGVVEAASQVGVSYPTLRKWLDNGSVRFVRIGETDYVSEGEISRVKAILARGSRPLPLVAAQAGE